MRKALVTGLVVLVALIALAVGAFMTHEPAEPPAVTTRVGPFFDAGYDVAPRFASFRKESRFVRLSDGTDLAVDIFVPVPASGDATDASPDAGLRFPTILEYTPYGRALAQPGLPWWQKLVLRWRLGLDEAIYDRGLAPPVRAFLGLGYAYVVADMRGTGASFGSQAPLMPRLADDGAEVVEWITSQPWSNGSVGMRGQSYVGWSQFATASREPEGLRCIAPALIVFDAYTGATRPGGITAVRWLTEYSDYLQSFNLSRNDVSHGYFPVAPVVDEDGDGRLLDEIPLASEGDPTLFVDDPDLRYPDDTERRQHPLARAVAEHRDNLLVRRLMEPDVRFADATYVFADDTLSFIDGSPGAMLDAVARSGVSVFNIGGWFDGFVKGTTKLFASMDPGPGNRLMIGPRFHIPAGVTPAYRSLFAYEGDLASEIALEELRFFDSCLRGIDNGVEDEDPVLIYVMNQGWRREASWPLERQEVRSLYLGAGGALTAGSGEPGADPYEVDFTHRSDYGSNEMNRWVLMWSPDTLMLRTEADERTLVYETPPLESEMEVTGHPVVELWVSANRSDADVFVYLSDVAPDGSVHYVTEGKLRAGFHESRDPELQTRGLRPVRPDLPWHGFRSGDYDPGALADGRVVELRFDLMPTSWLFREGHRLRISIAGADAGNFELNPALCPEGEPEECAETTLTIHRGPATPSRIEIPMIAGG